MAGVPTPDADRGVYGITTAADLVGMGVQNLRLYEARGLLAPDRTDGGTRRYSAEDLDRLRRIGDLLDAGLNLAGIGMVLGLESENAQLRAEREEHGWLPTARPCKKRPAPNASGGTPPSKRTR
jgi:MerR family transcriptional regulator, heat shock protein HspR